MFAPKIDILAKNGFIYSGGYDLLNKNIILGVAKKISLKR
jgi:hypothetical protein